MNNSDQSDMIPCISKLHRKEALAIWNNHAAEGGELFKRMPFIVPDLTIEPDILFVGINPSFYKDWIEKYEPFKGRVDSVFSWEEWTRLDENQQNIRLIEIIDFEIFARKKYKYYKSAEKFVENINNRISPTILRSLSVEFLDIMLIRETDHKKAIESNRGSKDKEFDLFFNTTKKLRPRCIVIANACASDYIENKINPVGDCVFSFPDMPNTPVFLSGMIAYGRMDRFSQDRLARDVAKSITKTF